jgi:hypothetical protein
MLYLLIAKSLKGTVPVHSCMQCCGTVIIYCGSDSVSGSDFTQVSVPVPYPDNIKHSFSTPENFHKILPFYC